MTKRTQFVLLDLEVRFLPNSPAKQPAPGPSVKPPATSYPDPQINHHNDGFKIVWIDMSIYPADLPDGWYDPYTAVPPDIPASWLEPVNFYDGTIHYRVNVMEKPDSKTLTSLISRVTTGTHEGTHNVWLGHGVVTFDRKGLHRFEQPVKAFRPFIRNTQFRFDRRIDELQLCVADSRGAMVHKWVEQPNDRYEGSPDLALYLPLKVRYTAVVVAGGAAFARPSWW
ncbi:MAG: hypothetical protein NTW28_14330 [Candidatus Solibacter sp.]|nr:hypothetical protein [Candidatus Solibacter sp.]